MSNTIRDLGFRRHKNPTAVGLGVAGLAAVAGKGRDRRGVNGSHHHFKHPTKPGLVTIPHPKKDLLAKTVGSILKQAGLK